MMRRLLFTAATIGAAYMVVLTLPDIARYLKIRAM